MAIDTSDGAPVRSLRHWFRAIVARTSPDHSPVLRLILLFVAGAGGFLSTSFHSDGSSSCSSEWVGARRNALQHCVPGGRSSRVWLCRLAACSTRSSDAGSQFTRDRRRRWSRAPLGRPRGSYREQHRADPRVDSRRRSGHPPWLGRHRLKMVRCFFDLPECECPRHSCIRPRLAPAPIHVDGRTALSISRRPRQRSSANGVRNLRCRAGTPDCRPRSWVSSSSFWQRRAFVSAS